MQSAKPAQFAQFQAFEDRALVERGPLFLAQSPEPADRESQPATEAAAATEAVFEIPEYKQQPPRPLWDDYFKAHEPGFDIVRRWTARLHNEKEHEHAIALIEAALIHGQSQPWMYEVLALSMEIAGRPKEDVERVVLSLSDFGQVDYQTMMYSGAYLARFDRNEAALRLYRQASRLLPERPEPYMLGLRLAGKANSPSDLEWAICGVLQHVWTKDFATQHKAAEQAALELLQSLRKSGNDAEANRIEQSIQQARVRDLDVRLEWSGAADLDLIIEEPGGSACSFEARETIAGGRLLHDGCGPSQANAYEHYVCPLAVTGDYRFVVRKSWGAPVANRALLKITAHAGTPQEAVTTETIVLDGDEDTVRFRLAEGRRTQPHVIGNLPDATEIMHVLNEVGRPGRTAESSAAARRAAEEFFGSREDQGRGDGGIRQVGAVGFAPVVTVLPEGTSATARAVVSHDRRYVRMALNPRFSNITDVFTFSFLNGGNSQGNTGQNGAGR